MSKFFIYDSYGIQNAARSLKWLPEAIPAVLKYAGQSS
jgi:hypothetical protein